ncbi:unnamed protein product, partial [Prorocentrum cordatum]
ARVSEIKRQRESLDDELPTVNVSLAKGREDLAQAQELLCKAHASEFDDPLKAVSAGLASSVVESTEGKAVLEKLQELQRAAEEAKRGSGEHVAANDGDGVDIDMKLLGAGDFEQRTEELRRAGEELK